MTSAGHIVRILVDLKVADADDRIVLHLLTGATQNRADAGHDLLQAEGLGHVVVASDGQSHHLVLRGGAGGEEQHGGANALLPDAAGHGESVDVREDDQVGLGLLDHLDGFGARCGGGHIESGEMQGCDEQFTDGRFVVNNDNGCFNRLAHALSITLFTGCFLNGF